MVSALVPTSFSLSVLGVLLPSYIMKKSLLPKEACSTQFHVSSCQQDSNERVSRVLQRRNEKFASVMVRAAKYVTPHIFVYKQDFLSFTC